QENSVSISTADGLFSTELGSPSPFSPTLFVNNGSSLYLEITVDAQIQSPRSHLIAVPFAETASNLNGQSPYTGGVGYRTFPFEARFSTYGEDGQEQIRLWGEEYGEVLLFDNSPANNLSAMLTAGEPRGGKLSLGVDSLFPVINLDAAQSGDNSVELPSGSISPLETQAEAGIANHVSSVFFTSLDSMQYDYKIDSVTITIPTDGFVELTAGCYINTTHVEGTGTDIFVGISKTQNIDYFVPGCVVVGISNARPTGNERVPAYSTRLYTEEAGTHTYFLMAERNSGGTNNTNVANPSIAAKFFPTAYGNVTTTSFDNKELPKLPNVSIDGSTMFNNPFLQVKSLEESNARLKEELQKAKTESESLRKLILDRISNTKENYGQKF
ncbi:MAG TPA: hypothetical protein VHP63_02080, partial [candidate division Zixibacteria bacterium]|nr:hypothetical protein [candidate division Zixibacteria bacterium]